MTGASGGRGKGAGGSALPWPELGGQTPERLYGLFGEEDFLVSQAVEAFMGLAAFSENPSLNVERFHAGSSPPARVLESARTLPFLGSLRLVVVQDFTSYKAAQAAEFVDYMADPSPTTTLLFSGSKLDARSRFAKALKKHGKVHIYQKLYPRQLPAWLGGRAAIRGKRLEPGAAERLADLAGLGLGALDSEVEKLSLYTGDKPTIGAGEVEAVTGRGRLYSIFDFTDALAQGSLERSLTSLDQLLALGEAPVRVLAMVTRLFRQLLEVRQVLDQGGTGSDVQSRLRIPPSATRTLVARAGRESAQSITECLGRILQSEMELKSSPASDRVIMERLVMELCSDGAGPSRAGSRSGGGR